jgi:hypothetical protein
MKKILLSFLIIAFFASSAFAWGGGETSRYKTHIVENSSTTLPLTTQISTNTIVPGKNIILGFDIMKYNLTKGAESFATLYDGDAAASGEVIGEAERDTTYWGPIWFPQNGRGLDYQLSVHQGPNTKVIIYFE